MNRTFMCVAAAATVAFFGGLFGATSALAQPSEAPPASHTSIDGNGVDVITGEYYPPYPSISIGQGPGSLAYSRSKGYEYIDALFSGINSTGNTYTVTLMGQTTVWTKSGSVYSPAEGQGGSLVESGSSFTYTTPDGTVAFYNGLFASISPSQANEGRVYTITYPSGEVLTFAYDLEFYCAVPDPNDPFECLLFSSIARPETVTSSLGYKLEYVYVSDTCCGEDWYTTDEVTVKSLFSSGAWQSLEFSGNDITDADGKTYAYTRNGSDQVTGVKFPGASSDDITITYDGSGRVASVKQFNLTTSYTYADNGSTRTTTITDPDSHVTTVTSNTSTNRVSSSKNALNQTTSFTYDSSGRLTETHAPEGNYTKYTYDSRGNITQVRNYNKANTASILSFEASYPATCTNAKTCNKPTWTKDALGNQTDYTYNSTHGGVLTVKAPSPGAGIARPQTTIAYTSFSTNTGSAYRPTSITACALTTASTCSGNAAETRVDITYSGVNDRLPTIITTKAGDNSVSSATDTQYDYQRRVTYVDGPLSGAADKTWYFYTAMGLVTGVIGPDPDGGGALKYRASKISYNARNQPYLTQVGTTTSTSSMASFSALQSTTVSYDSYGRPTKSTFASGGTTYAVQQTQYRGDNGMVNCVATRMNPGVFGSVPSACSLGTTGSYGEDRLAQMAYDALHRPTKVVTAKGTSVQADAVQTTYTTNGQVATLKDGEGNLTTYEYDDYDRRYKTRFPSKTAAGASSTTDYEQWASNNNGAVTSFTNRAGQTISYTLDNLSRVTASSGSGATSRTRSYDNLGRITALTGGDAVSYTYDALGRMLTDVQQQGTVSYDYDVAGRMTKVTYPGSFYVNYDYDVSGAVTKVRENGATSGVGVLATYEYDDLGRRTKLTRGNGVVTDYGFDGASRLTDMDHDFNGTTHDNDIDFSYNPAGQITQRTSSNDAFAFLAHYNIDADAIVNGLNQATSVDGDAVSYDSKGNVTSYDGVTYTYDAENFMVSAVNSIGGFNVTNQYDAAGRLTAMDIDLQGATNTDFLYAGHNMIAEYASGTLKRRWVYGPGADEVLVWYEGTGTSDRRFLVADERGSIVARTDASGNVVGDFAYDSYGNRDSSGFMRHQFTGQTYWGRVRAYYYKARFYHPKLGRFMQADPIGYADGMNMYGYVGGDPVNFTDPTGLAFTCTGSRIRRTSGDCSLFDGGTGDIQPNHQTDYRERIVILSDGGGAYCVKSTKCRTFSLPGVGLQQDSDLAQEIPGRAPTGEESAILNSAEVRGAIADAWRESNPNGPNDRRREVGFYISVRYPGPGRRSILISRFDYGVVGNSRILPGPRPYSSSYTTVFYVHTHPFDRTDGLHQGDLDDAIREGRAGVIVTRSRIIVYGPAQVY